MKEYYLIDKKDEKAFTLSPVTARVEKALSELGLSNKDFAEGQQLVAKWLEEGSDELLKLCNVLFRGREIKKDDIPDINKIAVKGGVLDFFLSDMMLMLSYGNSQLISTLATLGKTTEPQN